MTDIPASFFFNFSVFLFVPFLLALILRKKKISSIVGYMLGGILLSNLFGNFLSTEVVNSFAYFGILLLILTVGLEIRFEQLLQLKKYIIWGGLAQILISIFFIIPLSQLFSFNIIQSVLIGIALSSSSTSLVAKIIQDRGEEGSFHGELAMGILMFQDIAFIPFMIIFTSMTARIVSFSEVAFRIVVDMLSSSFLLFFVYFFGKKLVPVLFNKIARVSRELLNLFIILFIFLIAYVSSLFHVPILISIFVAGILISQTSEYHHIFSQIRPFRDILAIIFFIYIGTTIQLSLIFSLLPNILLFSVIVLLIKALVILIIFIRMKLHTKLSLYLALYLFQIDEDAFILMTLAYKNGMFTHDQYLFIVSSVLLSLLITPYFIGNKEKIYFGLKNAIRKYLPFLSHFIQYRIDLADSPIDILNIKDHVVLCGYGRIGSYIGRALMLSNIPFIAIDYNFETVERAKRNGVQIIYGDPTDFDILDYAETEHAVAIVLALPDRYSQEAIVMIAKKLNKNITVFSRVHRNADQKRMRDLGADIIIQPEFEASMSIIKKLLLLKNVPKEDIIDKLHYFKLEQEGI